VFALVVSVSALLGLSPSASSAATLPTVCTGPVVIKIGGTYSGCWVSNQQGVAVTIATSAPVTITNSVIEGTGRLVSNSVGHVKVAIDDTRLYGTYPGGTNRWADYAVRLAGFDSVDFEHNYIEHKGGLEFMQWTGVSSSHPVLVRYNLAKDIDGRLTDGHGGYAGRVITQFVQLNAVQNAPGVDISWNEIHNTANESAVEDNVNIFKSSGTRGSPIEIYDNFIDGAYPFPATSPHFSGGGILLADAGGSYQIARDNQVIRTTNYGIANDSGTHTAIYSNRAVASGLLPDGKVLPAANVGLLSWNEYTVAYGDNLVYGNVSGWMQRWNYRAVRNDLWLPGSVAHLPANAHLNNNNLPITLTDEANEYPIWQDKLMRAGITVGP